MNHKNFLACFNSYICKTDDLPLPEIDLGDRVVWLSDQGPELGTVKWIGILPDARIREYNIGVEFVHIMSFLLL